nr:PREDICTED: uncharacterized protein LOC103999230 [Musa acuminata subsp. malaccensis]
MATTHSSKYGSLRKTRGHKSLTALREREREREREHGNCQYGPIRSPSLRSHSSSGLPKKREASPESNSLVSSAARAASVPTLAPPTRPFAMEMRKIACAVLVAAATATTALAAEGPAPGPASAASFAAAPAVGVAIGASVLSFFAFYLQ